jgi:hypothetical protein
MRRQSPKDAIFVMAGLVPAIHVSSSFRRKPESSRAEGAKKNWTPAFAGVTPFEAPTVTSSTAWRRPG